MVLGTQGSHRLRSLPPPGVWRRDSEGFGDDNSHCCPLHHHRSRWGNSPTYEGDNSVFPKSPLTFFIQYLESKTSGGRNRRKRRKDITMSKTSEFGSAIDSEHLSELTEEEVGSPRHSRRNIFTPNYLDWAQFQRGQTSTKRIPVLGLQVSQTFLHQKVSRKSLFSIF